MKGKLLLLIVLCISFASSSQVKKRRSADGICMFYETSPKLYEFVVTDRWKATPDELIEVLSYKMAYHFTPPYIGFIQTAFFENGYLDTVSHGYNSKDDARMTRIYYCNCKLLFSDSNYNFKKLNESYDKNPNFNRSFRYTYNGKPVRFHSTEELLILPPDSVILFPKGQGW